VQSSQGFNNGFDVPVELVVQGASHVVLVHAAYRVAGFTTDFEKDGGGKTWHQGPCLTQD
jgi:hypothetical protein